MADAGKLLKFFERARHDTAMLRHEHLAEPDKGLGLLRGETELADEDQHAGFGHRRHLGRRPRLGEERRGDLVDLLVGALGRKHHRHQEREGVGVIQRHGRLGIELREHFAHVVGSFLLGHRLTMGTPRPMATRHESKTYSHALRGVAKPYVETLIL